MKTKVVLYTLLALLYSTVVLATIPSDSNQSPQAKNGVIDLRGESFSDGIELDGQWNFYWQQLINPGDQISHKGILVDFPFRWDGYLLNGKKLPDKKAISHAYLQYFIIRSKF